MTTPLEETVAHRIIRAIHPEESEGIALRLSSRIHLHRRRLSLP